MFLIWLLSGNRQPNYCVQQQNFLFTESKANVPDDAALCVIYLLQLL